MKVTGFTFIKNALLYDYPVEEAIRSVLPLCNEFVVAVGKSDDETLNLIHGIDPEKIRIIETVWDETLREGGRVLAVETDKSYEAISSDTDWCFYIQGDEIIHEQYHETILQDMKRCLTDPKVDGLLFHYLHFYGSYDYIATASNFYKKEIRIIRRNKSFYSYRDAQGFRKGLNEKLNVVQTDAYVYHYGWVKHPRDMQAKQRTFQTLWHDDAWVDQHVAKANEFDYSSITGLRRFTGTHPAVMTKRIERLNWHFDADISYKRLTIKDYFKKFLFHFFNIDLNYKNYRLLKRK